MAWDPSIILQHRQYTGPDANETMRTLADLAMRGTQQRQAEASLAEMVRKQQRQAQYEGLVQQNAAAPPAELVRQLRQAGLIQEAQDAEMHDANIQKGRAQYEQALAAMGEIERKKEREQDTDLVNTMYGAKGPEDWEARKQFALKRGIPAQKVEGLGEFAPGRDEYFRNIIIPADKQVELAETKRHHEASEKIQQERPPTMIPLVGDGGAYFGWNPRTGAPATPVTDDTGKPVVKPQPAENKLAERNVGGWIFDPKNPPTADGSKKMAAATIAREKILSALDRMEKLYGNTNPAEFLNPMGEAASKYEADWKEVTDQARIINEMGVPNGADYTMLAKQIPNPVGMAGITKTPSAIRAKFPALRTQINQTVKSTAHAFKFFPEGTELPGSKAAPAKTAPGKSPGKPKVSPEELKRQLAELDAAIAAEGGE